MYYERLKEKMLTLELFKNPTNEYRGAPFWSWNARLDEDELLRQIDVFKEMGIGGFHIHSRSGLGTEYLGDEFMRLVSVCNERAKERGMYCFLYDEDRWPSGSAGGLVTKDYEYRTHYLNFVPHGHVFNDVDTPVGGHLAYKSARRTLVARFKVELADGFLIRYERLDLGAILHCQHPGLKATPPVEGNVWDAYIEIQGDNTWFNNQAYLDTMSKKAVDRFIGVTHERYYETLKDSFGKTVPAIFTDEPDIHHKHHFADSNQKIPVSMPFTRDFDETYQAMYGESILDFLPELFWELAGGRPSRARYRYHEHVCARFTEAFADNIGKWCDERGIMLTGHMMHEESLHSQTVAGGESMRSYRGFGLPGIDMLADRREYSTAKQAQSVSRQMGRKGVMSELYGVTNWDFDFRGHKLQGDWQAALGVTLRVHHLAWVSMAGEAKRDYPAAIGYQSPWYKQYPYVEDYFARLNTVLLRGRALCNVAVIHPVESYWTAFGPNDKTAATRDEMETDFQNIIQWLLFGHIDFDFVSEGLLPGLYKAECLNSFRVGEMEYGAVVVPNCRSIRKTTLDALHNFRINGGTVLFAGEFPKIIDGEACDVAEFAGFERIPYSKTAVLSALDNMRDIEIRRGDGRRVDNLIYQLREDSDLGDPSRLCESALAAHPGDKCRWLFICNGKKPDNQDVFWGADEVVITLRGHHKVLFCEPMDGSIAPQKTEYVDGNTIIRRRIYMHDSLLFKLKDGEYHAEEEVSVDIRHERPRPLETYAYELDEPNVLVLDRPEYAFDDGEWQDAEDILVIDNNFRKYLGIPAREGALAQPWTWPESDRELKNTLRLRYTIHSQVDVNEVWLALEDLDRTQITLNGMPIRCIISNEPKDVSIGYYVDRSIKKVKLPSLKKGVNELRLDIKYGRTTNPENCFILGGFGVELKGLIPVITELPKALPFGDIVPLGFPFYGGNITYKCKVQSQGHGNGSVRVQASYFRCPLIGVKLNGEDAGIIAYAPYTLDLGSLPTGEHELEITTYGNRYNTFGTLHINNNLGWSWPNAWRSGGSPYSFEYQPKPTGILKSPVVF
ncbi:MAG: hypothetical protein FWC95_05680 [Defluviitaleaceae bacterium]|nr:hypothetical protein [Defluviitaleaceae bacterium]